MSTDGNIKTCPKCNTPRAAGSIECSNCGVIFARIKTKHKKSVPVAEPKSVQPATKKRPPRQPTSIHFKQKNKQTALQIRYY